MKSPKIYIIKNYYNKEAKFMKKLNQIMHRVYPFAGSLLVSVAVFGGVQPFSLFGFHQPKAPKCLK